MITDSLVLKSAKVLIHKEGEILNLRLAHCLMDDNHIRKAIVKTIKTGKQEIRGPMNFKGKQPPVKYKKVNIYTLSFPYDSDLKDEEYFFYDCLDNKTFLYSWRVFLGGKHSSFMYIF